MARYKQIDRNPRLLPVVLSEQMTCRLGMVSCMDKRAPWLSSNVLRRCRAVHFGHHPSYFIKAKKLEQFGEGVAIADSLDLYRSSGWNRGVRFARRDDVPPSSR